MLQSIALMLLSLAAFIGASNAAVLITIDNQGKTATDVFDNQAYYHFEDGDLSMRLDFKRNVCSMFLHEERVHIESKCDKVAQDMEAIMDDMLKQQGMRREDMAMMRKMMEQQRPSKMEIKPAGSETIAGYETSCYQINASRTMCVSEAVMALIGREISFKKMAEVMGQWTKGPFRRQPSGADQAMQQLWEKGYVMKDIDLQGGMPNAGALRMLPEAVRQKMMAQLQQAGGKPTGRVVVKVEKNAEFTPKLPTYPKKSIREFAGMMMRR